MSDTLVRLMPKLPVRLGATPGACLALGPLACELQLDRPVAAGEPIPLRLDAHGERSALVFVATPGEAEAHSEGGVRQRFELLPEDAETAHDLLTLLTRLRKEAHLEICLREDVEATVGPGFERVRLPHASLPDLDGDAVRLDVPFLGRRLRLPLVICGMTGGTPRGGEINRALAAVAQRTGVALGLGSQRSMLEDPSLTETFQVRDVAPDVPLLANLGAVQLNYGVTPEGCALAVERVGADALCLHLNALQEMIQPEGNRNFTKIAHRIGRVVDEVSVPVLLKETGTGMAGSVARLAAELGCAGIDVSGLGGTSWARVEALRHEDPRRRAVGLAFRDWGVTTVDSLVACRAAAPDALIVASGGVRSGQDMARALALGADVCGMALPLLRAVSRSQAAAVELVERLADELQVALMCCGARDVQALRTAGPASVQGVDGP